jgi:hypothetical protein
MVDEGPKSYIPLRNIVVYCAIKFTMNQIPTQVALLNSGFTLYKQSPGISVDPNI